MDPFKYQISAFKFRDIDKTLIAAQPNDWPILITINAQFSNEIVNISKM